MRHRFTHLTAVFGALGVLTATVSAQWQQPDELRASDPSPSAELGASVALTGNTLLAGSPSNQLRGAAYVFELEDDRWSQAQKLAPQELDPFDSFGSAVAMDGDFAIVGAYGDDDLGYGAGAAYVFRRSGDGWVMTQKLSGEGEAPIDGFGFRVAMEGSLAAVSAVWDDSAGENAGAVLLFRENAGVWTQIAELHAADAAPADRFGWGLALSGDTIAVGSLSGDLGDASGAVYVFREIGGQWTQTEKLLASDGAPGDTLGSALALRDGLLLVGAPGAEANRGAAYVFERSGAVWSQTDKLSLVAGEEADYFGRAVWIGDGALGVGSAHDTGLGLNSGAVHLFADGGAGWQLADEVAPGGLDPWDQFGISIAGESALIAVGASGDSDGATGAGAVFVFGDGGCAADFNGDGMVDSRDFIAYLGAWASGDAGADWNGDGAIDTRDFIAYLSAWAAGC